MRVGRLLSWFLSSMSIFVLVNMILFAGLACSEYPERPVTVIVGMDPGGPTDASIRAIAPVVGAALGKQIIVENKGGGGGAVALGVLANTKPDGYMVVGCQNDSIINMPLMQKVTFKSLASFTPIAVFAAPLSTGLLVKNDAPWKTFQEFMDYAKKNPGKIKYSTAGVGTSMHVAMEVIAHKDGIKWVHGPYKGSSPPEWPC